MPISKEDRERWAIDAARAELVRLTERIRSIEQWLKKTASPEQMKAERVRELFAARKVKKDVHWTQTTAGKRKMAVAQKRAWKARKLREKKEEAVK